MRYKEYGKRFGILLGGQILSAIGVTMVLNANVGLEPWSVLHEGLSLFFGISYGTAATIVGAVVIAIAVIMGESFGFGTLSNVFLCPMMIDFLLARGWFPEMHSFASGLVYLLIGMEILAIGTCFYMTSALGTGPRDALMVVLARKSGRSVGFCRIVVEILAVLVGWRLGGEVGIGTIIGAFLFGILLNINFSLLRFKAADSPQENVAETLRRFRGE